MVSRAPFETCPQMLEAVVEAFQDACAIEDGATRLSFAELGALVAKARGGLRALGVQPGDRVAIWAPNLWEWVVAALAIHGVGAALVPINTRYKGDEARHIVDRAGVRAVFTVDGFLGLDFVAMLARPDLPTVVLRSPSWSAFLEGGAGASSEVAAVAPGDTSDILFTSGTTGKPKGVVCSHSQSLRAYWSWSEVVGLRQGDRYLVVAPFFHCFGYKAGWLAALMRGATILPQSSFDVDEVLARISRDRVTMLPGPPALYQTLLMRDLSGVDLSSLRLAVTGAASIPVQLIKDMRERLGFETVITGYGLTESCGIATMCRFDDDPQTIATTSGRAIPEVEVRVVVDGRPAPPGEPGEVQVRGYNVMLGYLDDAEATAEAINDGWLKTGDVGVLDARGYLKITDRIKDMFIVGGFNVYPAEIEGTLAEHPAIAQAAVVGAPDARLGEVGVAYVVATAPLTEAELVAWCRARMANFKVPRRVVFVQELPRNASGKVLKYALREGA